MTPSVKDPWTLFVSSNGRSFKRRVSEQWIVRNCMHMLLGLRTEIFRFSDEEIPVVNSDFLRTCFCPHLSCEVLQRILKEIARLGSSIHVLRCKVVRNRVKHGKLAEVISEYGNRRLHACDSWIRQEIKAPKMTLIQLRRTLVTEIGDMVLGLALIDCAEMNDTRGFDHLRGSLFCTANDPGSLSFLAKQLQAVLLGPDFRPVPDLKESPPHDLLRKTEIVQAEAGQANLVGESQKETPSEQTFFICYVNQNRIVSY